MTLENDISKKFILAKRTDFLIILKLFTRNICDIMANHSRNTLIHNKKLYSKIRHSKRILPNEKFRYKRNFCTAVVVQTVFSRFFFGGN